jgi:hypothetical protein
VAYCSASGNVTSTAMSAVVMGAPSPSMSVMFGDGDPAASMDDDNGNI